MPEAIIIERTATSLIVGDGAPARIEISKTHAASLVIERGDIPGQPGLPGARGPAGEISRAEAVSIADQAIARAGHVQRVSQITQGQSSFDLDHVPADPDQLRMYVNGQRFGPDDFQIVGQTLLWSQPFTIGPTDRVELTYPR